ncbi:protein-L-isoaspartate O-methyltransferase family protein [Massilia timonae]|uniref:Protein-L-isoaspartate O-methyltransferase n=1 Tax=Massilia timonae TaxID=47229 RepID=A0A1S2NFZ2_9BURK|nr:protein-L-isoaspartate O-methyltransferase [Massilia timonae]OIJ44011.1 tRNA (Uracil-5-)-methyltransferase family protein [Massilia timonae]
MNIEQARFNMIEQQIRPWNVLDEDVLALLHVVKREQFVPKAYENLAFADVEIPLPGGETMFNPKVEARIVQEIAVKKHENVLEIGTGSGYMAALLAHKARHVTTVEIQPESVTLARENLAKAGVGNVSVEEGNGAQGWSAGAEYDVIVVSGGLPVLPEALVKQLKVGGRMIAILGEAPAMSCQLITRTSETAHDAVKVFETVAKPLTGAEAPSRFTF